MKRWVRGALVAVGLLVVAYPAAWVGVQHTDAYTLAESFIRNDAEVTRTIGAVERVKLPLFGTFSVEVSGGTGDAVFEMAIDAQRGKARAFVDLRKRGVWEITEARLVSSAGAVTPLTPIRK